MSVEKIEGITETNLLNKDGTTNANNNVVTNNLTLASQIKTNVKHDKLNILGNSDRPLSEQEKALRFKVMKFLGLIEDNPTKVNANDAESEEEHDEIVQKAEEQNGSTKTNQEHTSDSIKDNQAADHKVNNTKQDISDQKSNQATNSDNKIANKTTTTTTSESIIKFPQEESKQINSKADNEISTAKDKEKQREGKDWRSLLSKTVGKISNALSKLGPYSGFGNYNPEDHFSSVPEISDVESVAERIITKSNILVFTGPGISTGSGIPDFKVDQPYWTLKNGQEKIEFDKLLTKKFFNEKPAEVWRWHSQFRKLVINSAPNDAHYTLADIHNICKEIGINFTMITENIDNFHIDSYIRAESKSKKNYFEETKGGGMIMDQRSDTYGFCKEVFEVNGNINYMRCARNCCKKLFPSPLGCPEYFVPECPECKGIARPHTKFNDEDSDDYFFKNKAVQEKIIACNCLILVGTRLESLIATTMINQAITSGALIVEISSSPVLEFGNIKQLIGFPEELVPMLCHSIREKLAKFAPKTKS